MKDIRGESKACEALLTEQKQNEPICRLPKPEAAGILDQSALDIDSHLATQEIKREVLTMAESQVSLSLALLKKLGIQKENPVLSDRLNQLEKAESSLSKLLTQKTQSCWINTCWPVFDTMI